MANLTERVTTNGTNMNVAALDLGIGNLRSVVNMLMSLGVNVHILREGQDIRRWSHVFIPGVGSFDAAVAEIDRKGWRDPVREFDEAGSGYLVGICLGAQLLGQASEEGELSGLGLLPFVTRRFDPGVPFRVPRMGWDEVIPEACSPTWVKRGVDGRFYFSHSYFMDAPPDMVLARTMDGSVPAVVGSDRILGVQFHPEKSHKYGRNFLEEILKQ